VDTITDKVICLAGASAVSYYVLATPAQIVYDPNTKKYIPEDKKVTLNFYRKVGTGSPELLVDTDFKYSTNEQDSAIIPSSGTATVELDSTTAVKFYNSANVLLDTITIPLISNAASPYAIDIYNDTVTVLTQTADLGDSYD
jgi:hypothetical protein